MRDRRARTGIPRVCSASALSREYPFGASAAKSCAAQYSTGPIDSSSRAPRDICRVSVRSAVHGDFLREVREDRERVDQIQILRYIEIAGIHDEVRKVPSTPCSLHRSIDWSHASTPHKREGRTNLHTSRARRPQPQPKSRTWRPPAVAPVATASSPAVCGQRLCSVPAGHVQALRSSVAAHHRRALWVASARAYLRSRADRSDGAENIQWNAAACGRQRIDAVRWHEVACSAQLVSDLGKHGLLARSSRCGEPTD
jgi:hypothetical protein